MNLNMDIGDLFKRKNSGGRGGSNPFIGQIVTILIIAILAGSYIGLYWLPKSAQLTTFRTQAAEIDSLRMRREQLDRDIVISGQQLGEARTTHDLVNPLFHPVPRGGEHYPPLCNPSPPLSFTHLPPPARAPAGELAGARSC